MAGDQKGSTAMLDGHMPASTLTPQQQDGRAIPNVAGEIRLFGKIRNEAQRLPHFLDHYRRLGVHRFILIDNGSDDDTVSFLQGQTDCHVFVTRQRMAEARAGMDWIQPLLNRHGVGHWCVVVDADELLVYPQAETVSLTELCALLEGEGADAMPAMMLDMYPSGSANMVDYRPGSPFLQACPFFDRSGYRVTPLDGGSYRAIGGPRLRVFYPDMMDWRLPARLSRAVRYRLARAPVLRNLAVIQAMKPPYPPLLNKVPLVRWRSDFNFASAGHFLSGARFSAASAALLHFKFLGDFERRAKLAIVGGAYESGGADYKRYVSGLEQDGGVDFTCDLTERYESSEQLLSLGLIRGVPQAAA
jgi:hypothetical protein